MSNEPDKRAFGQSKKMESATPISSTMLVEELKEDGVRFKRKKVLDAEVTTNSYVDSLIVDCRQFERKIFHIKNEHATNGLKYKILACVSPEVWEELKAETTLAAATSTYEWDTEPWPFVKFQVKSAVDDTPAKATAWISGQK